MRAIVNGVVIETVTGDISQVEADAIVNAANSELWMGAGVAGSLKRRGGAMIEAEAVAKGPIPVGEAVETSAGRLKAKWVIHVAVMGPDLLTDGPKIGTATRNAIAKAAELRADSIAMPSLGTGVGGFPVENAAKIMLNEILDHVAANGVPSHIALVLYSEEVKGVYDRALTRALKSI